MKLSLTVFMLLFVVSSAHAMMRTLKDGTDVPDDVATKTYSALESLYKQAGSRKDGGLAISCLNELNKKVGINPEYCFPFKGSKARLVTLGLLSDASIIDPNTAAVIRNALKITTVGTTDTIELDNPFK